MTWLTGNFMAETKRTYKIYAHINKINQKIYIGQTCCKYINSRWRGGEGYKQSPYFYNAIKKYGWNNFDHIILFDNITDYEIADAIEQELIKKYKTAQSQYGYNLSSGGSFGRTLSEETKQKMRMSKLGERNPNYNKKFSPEMLYKLSCGHKNIKQTPEWIAKRTCSGEKNGMYGKHLSDETKKKISDKTKGGKNASAKKCYLFSNYTSLKEFECLTYAYNYTTKGNSYCRKHRLNGIILNDEKMFILTKEELDEFLKWCKENNKTINTIQSRYDAYNEFFLIKDEYINKFKEENNAE